MNDIPDMMDSISTFPELIDNSAISDFKKCPTSWMYSTLKSITRKGGNPHLHFGGAYAAGLEAGRRAFYIDGISEEAAVKKALATAVEFWGDYIPPDGIAKSKSNLVQAILEYFMEYPMGTDWLKPAEVADTRAVEFTFAVPLPILHPQTKNPILYGGRFDMLAEHRREGSLFIEDDKTTSQLGNSWNRNWILDSQITGYCWAAAQYGFPVVGAVMRGISILKTKFGHAQAIVYRPQWQIDRWYEQTILVIEDMIASWERGRYRLALDKLQCNSYGGCEFHLLCESPEPQGWIKMDYEPRIWNPLEKSHDNRKEPV